MSPYEWILSKQDWHITPDLARQFADWYAAHSWPGQHYEDAWVQSKLWAQVRPENGQ